MRQSAYFLKTNKTPAKDDVSINARLLEQGGFVQKTMAGVYVFLPLGLRVLAKIENIVRDEMNQLGANEVLMPALHPKENWMTTGRWDTLDVLFKIESQHGYQMALGPTHEEIVTPMALPVIGSYRNLPLAVYQIQTKFRDEPRAKSGLLRGREFRMKDLYSFHAIEQDLEDYYNIAAESYRKIFKRLGLDAIYTEASGGTFSKYSHEFQVEIPQGEDVIYICIACGMAKNKEIYEEGSACKVCGKAEYRETKASEVGNIFQLKTKFSEPFGLQYTAEDGSKKLVYMGCYGIGPSRIMGVIVERFNDDKGIIWPDAVAPFKVHLLSLNANNSEVREQAEKVYSNLEAAGFEVLFDDREDVSAGEKFADADLIGIPYRVVVSTKTLAQESVEIRKRLESECKLIKISDIVSAI